MNLVFWCAVCEWLLYTKNFSIITKSFFVKNVNFKQFHADHDKFTLSLSELYERFVQIKYEIYCVEKKKQDLTNPGIISDNEQLMDSFLTRHQKFAVYSSLKELENNIEMRDSEHPFIDSLVPIEIICAQRLCRPKILENILMNY